MRYSIADELPELWISVASAVGEAVSALVPDREYGKGCLLSLVQRAGEGVDSCRTALQVRSTADLSVVAKSLLPPVVP